MKSFEVDGQTLRKESETLWVIDPEGAMKVPVRLFTNEKLLEKISNDGSIRQACNVAALPGIQVASIVQADQHCGYGFPIGGVAAFDLDGGVISPGGIGFDINCGVRLLATPLTVADVTPRMAELLDLFAKNCPLGVGSESKLRLSEADYQELLRQGAGWAVAHGYGTQDDVTHCESKGCIPGADPKKASPRALARGRQQLGTVGAGNHFIEVQRVAAIHDPAAAAAYRITGVDQVVVLIHCGSRGFGHQICTEYIRKMEDDQPDLTNGLPDKNLIYAPLGSKLADDYFAAMCAAANYAFANRHILGHYVRESFAELFGREVADKIVTVYDICHNIAKRERHLIDGVEREVMVHRKGATRAFPPGFEELPPEYRAFGQPVLIPGSMGTASYLLHGTEEAMRVSFGSCAHGAGRLMSRMEANREFTAEGVKRQLADKHILIQAESRHGITEEAPGAYKDVDEVIKVCHDAGIAKRVAKMEPLGVVKG